jgi:hypothetical protein
MRHPADVTTRANRGEGEADRGGLRSRAAVAAAAPGAGSATATAAARDRYGHGNRARLRWILGGVGFQPAHGPPAFGVTTARRAGCPPHHGKRRQEIGGYPVPPRAVQSPAAGTAAAAGSGTASSAGDRYGHGYRSRPPGTGSVTDEIVAEHRVLRYTGLLSRSTPSPLQLTFLRRPAATSSSSASRSPPVGSAACLVTVARFSVTRFPRVPPSRMCSRQLAGSSAHSQGPHAHRYAP